MIGYSKGCDDNLGEGVVADVDWIKRNGSRHVFRIYNMLEQLTILSEILEEGWRNIVVRKV